VAATIVKTLMKINRKEPLMKIMRDCFTHIKKKEPSPSFSVERAFGLAFFAFVDFQMEEIFDMREELLLEIFGEEDEEALIGAV
jgi:hypothetical protein